MSFRDGVIFEDILFTFLQQTKCLKIVYFKFCNYSDKINLQNTPGGQAFAHDVRKEENLKELYFCNFLGEKITKRRKKPFKDCRLEIA